MCRIMMGIMEQTEQIHSGHFMVSQFEAEAQDDEYEVAVPVPDVNMEVIPLKAIKRQNSSVSDDSDDEPRVVSLSIETSLTKLFQCMSIAYRQKLTSPKWNRFKGVRLRWKEKIRLNNVIWRCWHMQFVKKQDISICQFASPLDVDLHSKPEAVVLEGKYWKRKLSAVTAEYKRWRLFYQKLATSPPRENDVLADMLDWKFGGSSIVDNTMMTDEDYMDFMSDTLFTTLTSSNQPFAFPDPREIARETNLADFIQPSLVQLQPSLDDFMDTLEPLQDLLSSQSSKLPSVPEEYHTTDELYRSLNVASYDQSPTAGSFYQPSSSSVNSGLGSDKFYLKTEQDEQPLQLSVNNPGSAGKQMYRNNNATTGNVYQQNSIYGTTTCQPSQQCYPMQSYHQINSLSQPVQTTSNAMPMNYIQNVRSMPITPINFQNASGSAPGNYAYNDPPSSYSPSSYSQSPSYPPSASSNYKMYSTTNLAKASRSGSSAGADDDVFAVPKLSLRGRSRSGSSLLNNHVRCSSSSNDQVTCEPVPSSVLLTQLLTNYKHYGYQPGGYKYSTCPGMAPPNCAANVGHESRACCSLGNNRQVAHCTALLGRRSRTPDHVLSSNSNPVGYSKPRTPLVTSQSFNEGSLINLSNNNRTDRPYGDYSYGSYRRHSQVTAPKVMYPPDGCSYSPFPSASSAPFVFTGNQHRLCGDFGQTQTLSTTASTSSSPIQPSSPSTSESLSLSPLTVNSPLSITSSPSTSAKPSTSKSTVRYKEHRRVCHINAEQKRRCNIKNGFDTLHILIPQLAQNPNSKMSKAAMLQKGAEYIRQLRGERNQFKDEIESLRQQVDSLNSAISNCQSLLPATGAPISRHRATKMKEMFDEYVRERTKKNWKFWILSLIFEPLLSSFNSSVSTANFEELFRTTIQWAEQYCSLVDLRPIVLNALRHLSTSTDILSNPAMLPEEVRTIVLHSNYNRAGKNQ